MYVRVCTSPGAMVERVVHIVTQTPTSKIGVSKRLLKI